MTAHMVERQRSMSEPASDVSAVLDLVFGRWRSQIAYAGARSGMLDALAGKSCSAGVLAKELGLREAPTFRLLRGLATLGLTKVTDEGHFALTPRGRLLTASGTPSLRSILLLEEGPEHYDAWKHLTALLSDDGQNGFHRAIGSDAWTHLNDNPAYRAIFQDAMSAYSTAEADAIVSSLSAADLPPGGAICDVGGGDGRLLTAVSAAFPGLSPILFDLPSVVESHSDRDRTNAGPDMTRVAGDMFAAVPEANAYILKHILHDWDDVRSIDILRTVHRHARPGARLLVCEFVIPDDPAPSFAALFDIHMMCVTDGRQRTASELKTLFVEAGWSFGGIRDAPDSPIFTLLGTRAP